ncbi:hypothetical protein [Streptomyces sp. URMC 123]|uniref:hypothetical protein n=1 Tax=Streptomyces sp. URMC 123 TaxID=3423403 RepID=UPI003F1D158B
MRSRSRHVRAVAVAALVVVALTGARRSGGGGCDDSPSGSGGSGSSSSSGGSGSTGGFSSGGGSTTGDSSAGSSSSSSSGGINMPAPSRPSTYDPNALGEVRGANCRYDQGERKLKYDLTVTNSSSNQSFSYSITTKWTEGGSGTGRLMGSDFKSVTVAPGQSQTVTADSFYTNSSGKSVYYTCKVDRATKFRAN